MEKKYLEMIILVESNVNAKWYITSNLHINLPWDLSRNNIVVFESILR